MDEERDTFLTEAMGKCWHEWAGKYLLSDYQTRKFICVKCGAESGWVKQAHDNDYSFDKQNLSTPEGFLKLWNWAIEQPWWYNFIDTRPAACSFEQRIIILIHPDRFADAVYKFLKEIK